MTGWPCADCPPPASVPQVWTLTAPACPPGALPFVIPHLQYGNSQAHSGTLRPPAKAWVPLSWPKGPVTFSPAQRRAADPPPLPANSPKGLSLAPQPKWLLPPPCLQVFRAPRSGIPAASLEAGSSRHGHRARQPSFAGGSEAAVAPVRFLHHPTSHPAGVRSRACPSPPQM